MAGFGPRGRVLKANVRASVRRTGAGAQSARPAPSYNDMVLKACALALREYPRANGSYRDGVLELFSRVNVGMAVAAQDALVVPTVHDADTKTLGHIARETRRLADSVRSGTVTPAKATHHFPRC